MMVVYTFFLIYREVNVVNGWTWEQMLLVTAIYFFVDRLFDSFFEENFFHFVYLINHGELDFILTKPLPHQFTVSLRRFGFNTFFSQVANFGLIVYLVWRNFWPVSLMQIVSFLVLIVVAVLVTYALWFMTLLPVFWFGRADNIHHLFRPLHQLTRIPIDATGKFRPFLTFVLPLAFIATVPAQSLIGNLNYWFVGYGVFISLFLLWLSHRLWLYSLKHYTSASS